MPKVTTQELEDLKRLDESKYPDNITLKSETALLRRRWIEESSSGLRLTYLGKRRLKDYLEGRPVELSPLAKAIQARRSKGIK